MARLGNDSVDICKRPATRAFTFVQRTTPSRCGLMPISAATGFQKKPRRNLTRQGPDRGTSCPTSAAPSCGSLSSKSRSLSAALKVSTSLSPLSQAARKVKPLMQLIQEMKKEGFNVGCSTPMVKCALFEDNSGTVHLANSPSMRPRTKQTNVKHHHFRSMVASRALKIEKTSLDEQLADFLTKQSSIELCLAHRMAIMGW